jgi:transcriptional regulator with XRE-family HTH domain
MINFQSTITPEYRLSDSDASGFPIIVPPTLRHMRQKQRSDFGQRVYDARKKAGLTQKELAKKAGFESQGSIAELEWIGQGSSNTLQLAAALGVSPDWLATGNATAPEWPFADIVTASEWAALPDEVKQQIRAAAQLFVGQYRQGLGKSSPSRATENDRHAA